MLQVGILAPLLTGSENKKTPAIQDSGPAYGKVYYNGAGGTAMLGKMREDARQMDAAGGMVDCTTLARLRGQNLDIDKILENNDAYHRLKAVDGLIVTGPTGTDVNDVSVVLCG